MRRWIVLLVAALIVVWGLNSSRPGSRVVGCPEGCAADLQAEAREALGDDGQLSVMSLNMLHGFPRFAHLSQRLDIIAEEIQRRNPDIVCLQEVPWTLRRGNAARLLAERIGLNHVYLRANGNRWAILFEEGEAILSRYPLRELRFQELLPMAGFFEGRVVLGATASTPWGDVRVYVTHLTHGDSDINRGQASSLLKVVEEEGERPAIVAGDFNATPDSPQIETLTKSWQDTYLRAHPELAGYTCCAGDMAAPTGTLRKRIDYIFLVPGAAQGASVISSERILDRPFSTASGWLWASDHAGLLTILELG